MMQLSRNIVHIIARLGILLAALFLFALESHPAVAAPPRQENEAQNTVLVHFGEGTTAEMRAALVAEMGGTLVTWMPQINVAEIRLPVQGAVSIASLPTVSNALSTARANGIVTYAEADMVVSATYAPNDPDFSDETMSYGLQQIQALDAWDIVTGSQQIVIAVIDSGIHLDHPEFAGRLAAGYDFIEEDSVPNDGSGHGTHVAGVIAAALDNDEGIAGVCPNCRLMPVKVLNNNNLGSWSQLAQGILFAVDNGARVLNLSLGASVPSATVASAVDYAVQSGVTVIAAAGNYNSDAPFYPAALDGVIAVGATTKKGLRWSKSDYGSYIDLVAPGDLIYSTYHDMDNIYHGYTYMSGTSMAAPFVSGVAGLLLSVGPKLSAADIEDALLLGAEDLGAEGWDPEFGHGRVNAMGSLLSPVPGLVEALGEITNPNQHMGVFLPMLGKAN
jgi:thermitase